MSPAFDTARVAELSRRPIAAHAKGFATGTGPPPSGMSLRDQGVSLFDGTLSFPLLALRESALAHNIAQLARFVQDQNILLAPHGKTTMAPQIFARQLQAGAWGLTAATIAQVRAYRHFGVNRILLANEMVDPGAIAWVAAEIGAHPDLDFYCYVDSVDGVRLLDDVLRATGDDVLGPRPGSRRLNVLVELGFPGGRTGCRTLAEARVVATAAASTQTLAVAGVSGYEGGLGETRDDAVLAAVRQWCGQLLGLLDTLLDEGTVEGPGIVSAGGSSFPDTIAEALADRRPSILAVLRSGCYVTHDHGLYADLSPFTERGARPQYALRPALELWARVTSTPEPGLAILDFGRRDAGFDHGLPIPLRARTRAGNVVRLEGVRISGLNDQHAYLEIPDGVPLAPDVRLAPGDLVGLGISHPCTTLDRWQHAVLVDDDDRVLDVVTTFF